MRRLLSAACVGLALLAWAGTAAARPSDAKLLVRFQPVTRFDPAEGLRPTSVETFVADSALEALNAPDTWTVADPAPRVEALPAASPPPWRLNQRACSPATGLAGLGCYVATLSAHAAPQVVYGRVARVKDRTVLQYWYFYYDDFYSYTYPPADLIWQAHEGDWEVVNVVLGRKNEPLEAGYGAHCSVPGARGSGPRAGGAPTRW
jgi:hypothetical protein